MNNLVKVEVWDDNFLKDARVGTHYLKFKDIQNKNSGARWMNLYGPPLLSDFGDADYADLMTLQGAEKGSTYRGRLLYTVETKDSDNPLTGTRELHSVHNVTDETVRVKLYLLKVALYEGVELPELFKNYAVVASCGPYEVASTFAQCKNSKASWNQYLDLRIRGPELAEDIPDIILYLVGDNTKVSLNLKGEVDPKHME